MRRALVSAIGLLAAFACNTASKEPEASSSAGASAAIQALSARDDAKLAQCQRAVDACNARVADAAGSGVCTRLAERCDALQDRLAELRGPAEGCLRAVDACENQAPPQAQCSRDLSLCEALDEDAAADRDKALECEARVQACLERAREQREGALAACDNMAAACDRVAENRANAGRGDAGASSGDDSTGDDSSGDDDSSADDDDNAGDAGAADGDSSGDDDGADGNGNGNGRPDRPPVGRGRGQAKDAGVDKAG